MNKLQDVDRCVGCNHHRVNFKDGRCWFGWSLYRGLSGCGCKCVFPSTSVSEAEDKNSVSAGRDLAPVSSKSPRPAQQQGLAALDTLAADVLAMCKVRGWSLHWTHRGAYLHLESSELIEAVRGKRGSVVDEAGDVLLVLMSITEYAGIPFTEVVGAATTKLDGLFTKPHYAGEEWTPHNEPERETES